MEKRLLAPELYTNLVALAAALERIGETEASRRVSHVSRFISGSTSELYGEARMLLPTILEQHGERLADLDRARLRETIAGIEREFGLIGGA